MHSFEDGILTLIPEDSVHVNVDLDSLKIPKQPRHTDFKLGIISIIGSLLCVS